MDLQGYLDLLKRRWSLLLMGPLLAGLGGLIISGQLAPSYQATVRILLNPEPPETLARYADAFSYERFANTYAALVTSPEVLGAAGERLDLPLGPDDFADEIRATPIRETQLIEITVTDEDPQRAASVANTVAEVLRDENPGRDIAPGTVSIIQPATAPANPVSPNHAQNLLFAMVLGLMLAGLATVGLEMLDNAVKTPAAAAAASGAPALAVVEPSPSTDTTPQSLSWLGGVRDRFKWAEATLAFIESITGSKGDGHARREEERSLEGYRQLRTSLTFGKPDPQLKTIVVTSPNQGEGKSTVAAHLAIVLAQAGDQVILIDADLRQLYHEEPLDVPKAAGVQMGLAGLLVNNIMDPSPALVETAWPNLRLLPSGPLPQNPAELLSSERMWRLITSIRSQADFAIFDTPGGLAVTDAVVLAARADATLLVAAAGQTRVQDLEENALMLRRAGASIAGVILNKTRLPRGVSRRVGGHSRVLDVVGSLAGDGDPRNGEVSRPGQPARRRPSRRATPVVFHAPAGQRDEA